MILVLYASLSTVEIRLISGSVAVSVEVRMSTSGRKRVAGSVNADEKGTKGMDRNQQYTIHRMASNRRVVSIPTKISGLDSVPGLDPLPSLCSLPEKASFKW